MLTGRPLLSLVRRSDYLLRSPSRLLCLPKVQPGNLCRLNAGNPTAWTGRSRQRLRSSNRTQHTVRCLGDEATRLLSSACHFLSPPLYTGTLTWFPNSWQAQSGTLAYLPKQNFLFRPFIGTLTFNSTMVSLVTIRDSLMRLVQSCKVDSGTKRRVHAQFNFHLSCNSFSLLVLSIGRRFF
jgi:hypothetical protein